MCIPLEEGRWNGNSDALLILGFTKAYRKRSLAQIDIRLSDVEHDANNVNELLLEALLQTVENVPGAVVEGLPETGRHEGAQTGRHVEKCIGRRH